MWRFSAVGARSRSVVRRSERSMYRAMVPISYERPKARTVSRNENQNFSTLGTVTWPSSLAMWRRVSITAATSISLGQRSVHMEQDRQNQIEFELRTWSFSPSCMPRII